MYAVFCFDTEDVYFPPKYQIDDIPGWLAEIMTECGVRGTFFVMAEKARALKARGRTDVIEKLVKHDLGSHQHGNVHPLIPEILQDKEWDDGVDAMRAYEAVVTQDHLDAFGREPVALSRHNAYFAPQHVAVAGERAIPYMYGIGKIDGHDRPTWYAGALTFPWGVNDVTVSMDWDTIFSRDEVFEQRLTDLRGVLDNRIERGFEYVTIFGCHPVRVMTRGWQEMYCIGSGETRRPQELGWLYGVKSEEEKARGQANFRRLVEYLRDHPDVEVVGIQEAAQLFSAQPSHIRRDVLTLYADAVLQAGRPVFHSAFSPAELVCGFAASLLRGEEFGDLSSKVERRDVLGPKSRPVVAVEQDKVTHEQMITLCRQVSEHVSTQGCLPGNAHIGGARIGIGQFALLAAKCYQAQARYERYEYMRVQQTPRYPDAAFEVDAWIRRSIGEHPAMPLDFTCDRLAEHARLQTWTMKPAYVHPPQGPAPDGERILAGGGLGVRE